MLVPSDGAVKEEHTKHQASQQGKLLIVFLIQ